MNWRSGFRHLFFAVWIIGGVAITVMVVDVLRIPLNPLQRVAIDGRPQPKIPDCTGTESARRLPPEPAASAPEREPMGIEEFVGTGRGMPGDDRPAPATGPDASGPGGLADLGTCLKERDGARTALAEWRRNSAYAFLTAMFWYRGALLAVALVVWSLAILGPFYLGLFVIDRIIERRTPLTADGYGASPPGVEGLDPSFLNSKDFDPEFGPVPIPGIGPPLNPVGLSWAELKEVSDAFREFEIPGPGICLSCRKKGAVDMHPIENMYALMHGAKADRKAGLQPRNSPFLIGTCRACVQERHKARARLRTAGKYKADKAHLRNAIIVACAVTMWILLFLLWVPV